MNIKDRIDEIKIPEHKLDNAIKKGIKRGNKRINNKTFYFSSAAVLLLLSLFFSSTFISPTMAQVISNIPFVNSIINPGGSLSKQIDKELEKGGFNADYINTSYRPHKMIEVGIESTEKEFKTSNKDINNTIDKVLKQNNYDAFTVKILRIDNEDLKKPTILSKSTKMEIDLENQIIDTLDTKNIHVVAYGISIKEKEINLKIKAPTKYYDDIKSNSENIVRNTLISNNLKGFKINLKRQDEVDQEWANNIIPAIAEELMGKVNYYVTSTAYTLSPKPTIIIKTSVSSSTSLSKDVGKKIEENIKQILSSEKIKALLNNNSYQINVYSEDQKRIN